MARRDWGEGGVREKREERKNGEDEELRVDGRAAVVVKCFTITLWLCWRSKERTWHDTHCGTRIT